jgi:hypothetical protein
MTFIDKCIIIACCIGVIYTHEARSDTYLDINGLSKHSINEYCYQGKCQPFNQTNPGLGITTDLTNHIDLKVGGYKNSYYKTSLYAGINIHTALTHNVWNISPGIMVGMVSGYDKTPMRVGTVVLSIIPNVAIHYQDFGVVIGYIPPVITPEAGKAISVVTMQFQYQLN